MSTLNFGLLIIVIIYTGLLIFNYFRFRKILKIKENCLVEEVENELLKPIKAMNYLTIILILVLIGWKVINRF
jgi:hypothetical protein